ncbi:maleylpyruvate isomerase N-terminal domain-containing protein [Amycolatopsis benzoatilytica]|uniref:maleylpyruvate isomerase N-terminal domain-containing protein n=1 Tax=Amycolatopsis benzoatilytica TaxID=346045 RepID=UPI00036F0BBB|nr:maleylpyruvate isomerase N-terminal domain-containing protein [Amycolatopsis benzoatilytica]
MDLLTAHSRALTIADEAIRAIGDEDWARDAPSCPGWTVHDLVSEMVVAERAAPDMLAGRVIYAPDPRWLGDVLGVHPVGVWEQAARAAREAWLDRVAVQPAGDVAGGMPIDEYGVWSVLGLVTRSWDIAVALGKPNPLPDDLADWLLAWATPLLADPRHRESFDSPVVIGPDPTATDRLLALTGRQPGLAAPPPAPRARRRLFRRRDRYAWFPDPEGRTGPR